MAITPQTNIYLLKCPLEEDNLNQLTFDSKSVQLTYFSSLPHKLVQNSTYQRHNNVIRYPDHIDNILDYNYVMYQNENYSNKWFYAFITNMRYINDGMTEISIKTDVFQTWQHDIVYKQSFIEREHTNNDSIGANTIPENVELGEFVSIKGATKIFNYNYNECVPVLGVTQLIPPFNTSYSVANQYVPDGLYYIGCENVNALKDAIKVYNSGYADSISTAFVIPKEFFSSWTDKIIDNVTHSYSLTVKMDFTKTASITPTERIDYNYTPVNKKLLTYPYRFLQASNNSGQVVNYRYEDFKNVITHELVNPSFFQIYTFGQGGSALCIPVNYKGLDNNHEEAITLGKLPIGSYNTDSYTNWLTQNALNIGMSTINSGIDVIGGVASASNNFSAVGSASNGIRGIESNIQRIYNAQFIPNQVSGKVNSGEVNFLSNLNCIKLTEMTIKREYGIIIDNYFSMYGYKTNRLKTPNIRGRRNWNYVKTIGANIEGNIPQTDIEELKSMFNTGVTLWHNPSTYLDYSQSNPIV